MRRDRLLAVSGIAPWPRRGGFSLRSARLLELLARDWAITLVSGSVIDGEPPLGSSPHQIITTPVDTRWASVPSRRTDFGPLAAALGQAVESFRPRAALMFNGTEFLAMRRGFPPTIADRVDCGALERLRYLRYGRYTRRPKAVGEMLREAWYERQIVRAFPATLVAGEDDRRALEAIAGTDRVHVVGNGVDPGGAGPAFDQESAVPTIAFTGTLSYYANVDAIVYFTRRIWPLVRKEVPNARLLIAGRTPSRRVRALATHGEIEVRADVAEMRTLLAESWIAIAPMRCGTGVKNKVLEAWAAARPVVMTQLATNGLSGIPDPEITVKNGSAEFARAVTTLLRDTGMRHQLGEATREHVLSRHSWSASAHAVSEILEAVSDRILRP